MTLTFGQGHSKSNRLVPAYVQLFHKFHEDLVISFWVILLTDKQASRQTTDIGEINLLGMERVHPRSYILQHSSLSAWVPVCWQSAIVTRIFCVT